jgi:hypothetical protein
LFSDEREQLLHGRAHDEAWTLDFFDVEKREFASLVVSRSFADAIADACRHSQSDIKPGQEPGATVGSTFSHGSKSNEVFVKVGRYPLASAAGGSRVAWDAAVKTDGKLVVPTPCEDDPSLVAAQEQLTQSLRSARLDDVLSPRLTPLLAPHFEDRLSRMSTNSSELDEVEFNNDGLLEEEAALLRSGTSDVEGPGGLILDDDAVLVDAISAAASASASASATGDANDLPRHNPSKEENYTRIEKKRAPTRGVGKDSLDPDGGVDPRSRLTHTLVMKRQSVSADYSRLAMLHHSDSHGAIVRKSKKVRKDDDDDNDDNGGAGAKYRSEPALDDANAPRAVPVVYGAKWPCTSHGRRHRHAGKGKEHAVPVSEEFFATVMRHADFARSKKGVSPNLTVEVRIIRQHEPEVAAWSKFMAWAAVLAALVAIGTGGAGMFFWGGVEMGVPCHLLC